MVSNKINETFNAIKWMFNLGEEHISDNEICALLLNSCPIENLDEAIDFCNDRLSLLLNENEKFQLKANLTPRNVESVQHALNVFDSKNIKIKN
jgi:hypothetical protein